MSESKLAETIRQLSDKYVDPFLPSNPERDKRIRDIKKEPHIFFIGCLMNSQIPADQAWNLPFELEERIGDISMPALSEMKLTELKRAFNTPTPLHRHWPQKAEVLSKAASYIVANYSGQPEKIWSGPPRSAAIIWRFLEFDGVGPKIATMAANILVRNLKIKVADKSAIDISVDTHVKRLFKRTGLLKRTGLSNSKEKEIIIFQARDLCPDYPGVLDLPLWKIGKEHCHPKHPSCEVDTSCPLYKHCQRNLAK